MRSGGITMITPGISCQWLVCHDAEGRDAKAFPFGPASFPEFPPPVRSFVDSRARISQLTTGKPCHVLLLKTPIRQLALASDCHVEFLTAKRPVITAQYADPCHGGTTTVVYSYILGIWHLSQLTRHYGNDGR